MTAIELCHEAARRGLRLEPAGEKLAVIPAGRCSEEFARELRQHKREILDWLEICRSRGGASGAATETLTKSVPRGISESQNQSEVPGAVSCARLTPDCIPWLEIARQVLAGEYDGCDGSSRESLVIGLRGIEHSTCRRALEYLKKRLGRRGDLPLRRLGN